MTGSRLPLRVMCEGVDFFVAGVPAPQGSKNPWGGEANPRTMPWRATVSAEGVTAMKGQEPMSGPVVVLVRFKFPRPKSHYRTGKNEHLLRPAAPLWHTSYPDLDKLQRAIGDALTGIVIRDDKQIARWDVTKTYGAPAGASLHVFLAATPFPEREGSKNELQNPSRSIPAAIAGEIARDGGDCRRVV